MTTTPATTRSLVRPRNDRWIAGVCAGLAHRFGISPNTMRLIFALSCLLPGPAVHRLHRALDPGPLRGLTRPGQQQRPAGPGQGDSCTDGERRRDAAGLGHQAEQDRARAEGEVDRRGGGPRRGAPFGGTGGREDRGEQRRGRERDPHRHHHHAAEEARRCRQRSHHDQAHPHRRQRAGGQRERRHPVGHPGERQPAHHDDQAVREHRDAGVLEPDPVGVQRPEREEAADRHQRGEEREGHRDRGPVDELPVATVVAGVAWRFGQRSHEHDRDRSQPGGDEPGDQPTRPLVRPLAERRPEREPEVQAERVVADRLAQPLGRRQVGEQGEAADEERRLGDALRQPDRHHRRQRRRERQHRHPGRAQRRTEQHQPAPPVPVGEPPGVRPADQRRDRERTERQPCARLVGPDRAGRPARQQQHRDADRREVGEVRESEQHEGPRQQRGPGVTAHGAEPRPRRRTLGSMPPDLRAPPGRGDLPRDRRAGRPPAPRADPRPARPALVRARLADRPGPRRRVDVHRRHPGAAAADAPPGRDGRGRRALRLPQRHARTAGAHQPVPRGHHLRARRRRADRGRGGPCRSTSA